jgi:hypothetical protein
MGIFGKALGGFFGSLGSSLVPINGVDGQSVGNTIGGWLPFKKGGQVKLQPINYSKLMKKGGIASKRKYQKKKK